LRFSQVLVFFSAGMAIPFDKKTDVASLVLWASPVNSLE
jgi:hypothetical protein